MHHTPESPSGGRIVASPGRASSPPHGPTTAFPTWLPRTDTTVDVEISPTVPFEPRGIRADGERQHPTEHGRTMRTGMDAAGGSPPNEGERGNGSPSDVWAHDWESDDGISIDSDVRGLDSPIPPPPGLGPAPPPGSRSRSPG
eukprot:2748321-Pyramimonas_sp.AAC.1